jgi:glucose/mannose-6-phosphate isomerase
LRDEAEHEAVTKRVKIIEQLVLERSIPLTQLWGTGKHPLNRISTLVIPTDWASVYAALVLGIDPSVIKPIVQLKAGLN